MQRIHTTLERFAEFIYNSNLIEGISELSYSAILKDVKNLLTQKKNRTHTAAFADIYDLAREQKNFRLRDLLRIHAKITFEQLVLGHPIETKYIGKLRDCGVRIGFGIIPPPAREDLQKFFRGFNRATKSINSKNLFKFLSEQHLVFERIHPFADGNGRAGRLLLAYQFLFAQFAEKISSKLLLPQVGNSKKQAYYIAFRLFESGEKKLAIKKLADFLEESS